VEGAETGVLLVIVVLVETALQEGVLLVKLYVLAHVLIPAMTHQIVVPVHTHAPQKNFVMEGDAKITVLNVHPVKRGVAQHAPIQDMTHKTAAHVEMHALPVNHVIVVDARQVAVALPA